MQQEFDARNYLDVSGNPAGGMARATGIKIEFQDGPLGRGTDRKPPNGAFVETLLAITKQRIEFYQSACDGKFACRENALAITLLEQAMNLLEQRTQAREAREVEGTHEA